ncbi:uncharacterized protein LOC129723748 [Wyeomyia smithii]|uniref:uncharacterized protein LOC129723748 n=1 Tax=Wyeomyia smithii TaxID=174621 RepID=UPI002467EB3C|nr:uncharacterized protein LOC129723748 [Wyeomyia smithii]
MTTNNLVTRSMAAKTNKDATMSTSQSLTPAIFGNNFKRSRDDLDRTDDFEELLGRMQMMIDEGNKRIERKIDDGNRSLMQEIGTLRCEMEKLRDDTSRDIIQLTEKFTKTELDVGTNRDAIARLENSADLLLTGVPYNPSENTSVFLFKVASALGYSDSDVPVVFSKRLARVPIAVGSSPPILFQNLNLSQLGFDVTKRVYLNENLCESARQLKGHALKLKKEGRIQKVFTKHGVVFVKTNADSPAEAIRNQDQLKLLSSKNI